MESHEKLSRPVLDEEAYMHYLDGMDLSIEEKKEVLRTVWNIMDHFVGMAWGDDSSKGEVFEDVAREFFDEAKI